MSLSQSDIGILSEIDSYQKKRRTTAWSTLGVVLVGWAALTYLGMMSDRMDGMITIIVFIALSNAIRAQFRLTTEDKLIELMRSYVNRDAEAIKQMSTVD